MKRLLVAHPGTQHAAALARQLHRRGLLATFACGATFAGDSAAGRLLAALLGDSRRVISELPRERLATRAAIELAGRMATGLGLRGPSVYRWRNEIFQRSIGARLIRAADAVVGFDTSSWLLAQRARGAGRPFILDQTIGHPASLRRVLDEVARTYPEWEAPRERKSDEEIARESREHALADLIVAPSRFVADTLVEHGVAAARIRVVPFGTDVDYFSGGTPGSRDGRTTFLFAGSLTARKGVPVLLDAWRRLDTRAARLLLAGPGALPAGVRRNLPDSVTLLGPLARAGLRDAFKCADVFVFPSLFEGQAIVQLEAAASGLPLVATRSAGADSIVAPGDNGLLVEAADPVALAAALERCLRMPAEVAAMKAAAQRRVREWSWDRYGERWAALVESLP